MDNGKMRGVGSRRQSAAGASPQGHAHLHRVHSGGNRKAAEGIEWSTMQNGDIVVTASPWWKRALGAQFDHAAICWQHSDGHWYTVESGFTGTRAYPYGHWRRPWLVLRPMHATPEQRERAADGALQMLGAPYKWIAFLAIGWRVIRERHGVRMATVAKVVCTELVVEVYRLQGVDLCPGERADRVTPDMVSVSEELELVAAHEQHRR